MSPERIEKLENDATYSPGYSYIKKKVPYLERIVTKSIMTLSRFTNGSTLYIH